MPKQIDIAAETQRTIDGMDSCSRLLEKLTGFLCRLARHPEQELDRAATTAIRDAQAKLKAIQRNLESLAPARSDRPVREVARDGPGYCVLRGFSPAVPIASVLAFLSSNHKCGTLRVRTTDETFSLEIVDGDVVHTFSDRSPDGERLGDILVQRGLIDQATLDEFLEKYASSSGKMGAALEREELVGMAEMRTALEVQTQRLFHRIFGAEDAAFYFYRSEAPPPDLHIRMKMIHLLLESARTQDEEEAAQANALGPCS